MKADCSQIREQLADLVEGREAPQATIHLETCAACQKEFALLKLMIKGLQKPVFEPSKEAISRAVDLMPKVPIRTARLVLGQMGLVRSAGTEEFQLVFEEEGMHARLMYQPLPNGWSVTGRIDGEILSIEGADGDIQLEEQGRFRFEVADLQNTDLYVMSQSGAIKIPAATEANPDGSERSS